MTLTVKQIQTLLERTKWTPLYSDNRIVLCKKDGMGYSDDPEMAKIQGALSIMLAVASKVKP